MSTSPSWFDQEKFSRLVKKVGPKTPPASAPAEPAPPPLQPVAPAAAAAKPPTQPLPTPTAQPPISEPPPAAEQLPVEEEEGDAPPENIASTARISLVSRPPSLTSEQRALPALPRRTAPLPALKSLFDAPKTDAPKVDAPKIESQRIEMPKVEGDEPRKEPIRAPFTPFDDPNTPPIRATGPLPQPVDKREDIRNEAPPSAEAPTPAPVPEIVEEEPGIDDIEGIWHKMSLLNEELAQAIHERDAAVSDANLLREQLRTAEESVPNKDESNEEIERLTRERDDALAQAQALKTQLAATTKPPAPPTFGKPPEGITKTKELVLLTTERDQARKEYAELRKQYEALKQGQGGGEAAAPAKDDSAKIRRELEQQVEGFRVKLEEKTKEIALLKAGGAGPGGDSELMKEIASLRDQVTKSKEEASIAQRGLALSQKALHETRETLREATEGTSLSRHNFDNLKAECAQLTQQNAILQAQNDQLNRELAATKSKLTSRL